jgi:hypothetical protein
MPAADVSFSWQAAAFGYLIVVLGAFAVSFIGTDVLRMRRTGYVGLLALTVIGFGVFYVPWSGMSRAELVSGSNLGWGIVAGLAAAAVVTPLIRRLPRGPAPAGLERAELVAWEDVVYGAAEALLLAVYPVLTVWQAATAAGWTGSGAGKVASGVVAVAGSLLVILVHHLGYEEFRTRAARQKLAGALFSCGMQAIAYVLTGAVAAPVIAHIVLHIQLTMHGTELPPARRVRVTAHG